MTEAAAQTTAGSTISTEEIRAHFPALERRYNDYPVAYFDGPGGTQVPRGVAEAMVDYLFHHNANTHWAYPTSEETDEAIAEARQTCADFLNAQPDEIVFGANMTTLAFHLSRALNPTFNPGDEIIITELDHHANVAPWRIMERERGVVSKVVQLLPQSGELDWESFTNQLSSRTKLVAIGAASNALGTINDVRRAAEMAHVVGALVFVDAVHSAPHLLTDVRAINCDFLACSAYKFYGPHIGILFGKRDLLQSLEFPKLLPAPDTAPERGETGTQNQEGIVGAAAAVDFLASLSVGESRRERLQTTFASLHSRGKALAGRLWEGLSQIEGVTLYGPPPSVQRTPTLSFTVRDVPSTMVARKLAKLGIFASHGDFYAATVIERLGLSDEGLVRAGCACYTTIEEIERLIAGVRAIADERRSA